MLIPILISHHFPILQFFPPQKQVLEKLSLFLLFLILPEK